MTQQEFETRTNVYLTDEIFAKVHEEYMANDMDKDAFCKWWVKNRQFAVTKQMAMEVYFQKAKVEEYREQYSILADNRNKWQAQCMDACKKLRELKTRVAELEALLAQAQHEAMFNAGYEISPDM